MTFAEAEKNRSKNDTQNILEKTHWSHIKINLLGAVDVKFPDKRWCISIHPSELK